jgi:hypothetical protein
MQLVKIIFENKYALNHIFTLLIDKIYIHIFCDILRKIVT